MVSRFEFWKYPWLLDLGLTTEYPALQSYVRIATWFSGELATASAFISYLLYNEAKDVIYNNL